MRGPARHTSHSRYASSGTIDLGNEPPLTVGKEPRPAPPRHAISFRWLGGTILTGLTSIFLMGGALMAALDEPTRFVDSSPRLDLDAESSSSELAFGRKGDRMQPIQEEVSSRQLMQVSTVTRQGERDFIKLRPFAKISATLGRPKDKDKSEALEIPAYDVMRIFATNATPDGGNGAGPLDDQISDTNVDGEVAVKVSAMPLDQPPLDPIGSLDTAAVEEAVRTASKFGGDAKMASALAYSGDEFGGDGDLIAAEEDPFSALGVKIVAENVSNVAKTSFVQDDEEGTEEKIISVVDNDPLIDILRDNDVANDDAESIASALSALLDVKHIEAGKRIRVAYAHDDQAGTIRPIRVSIYEKDVHQATVALSDNGEFVRADEPPARPDTMFADADADRPGAMPRVYDAVYRTALEQEMPPELVDQLIRVFAFDVDFQSRIGPHDAMEVFHSMPDPNDRDAGDPEILYASLTLSGVTKRFYRFRTSDDGVVDYYDEDGKSAKKFLMRKPLPGARITSGFGYRRHPILGRGILHTGVDYGGRGYGAPIMAAGNGIVEKAGRASGYGNLIVLRHTNGYETYYGHQQSFAKGIVPGVRVRQGQIIGYVGSTGQSTGPHLHYEIRINNKPVDPLRIRLPEGRVLDGGLLTAFENERARIDALLGNQPTTTTVASSN